jgi:acetolactate synthase-1/2/3 large subunit
VVIAGGGAITAKCSRELTDFAERLSIPVATTLSGKGIVAETHPWSIGVCGSFGTPLANRLLEQTDCVVFVGTKAGQGATFDWKLPPSEVTSIHIDVDPDEIGRNYRASIGIHSDALTCLQALLDKATTTSSASSWDVDELASLREEWWERSAWSSKADSGDDIAPQAVFATLRKFAKADDILVADASLASGWGASRWQVNSAGRVFLAPRGMAGLGWGLPASIGAALAFRDQSERSRRILCVAGDGGWGYSVAELEVLARLGLNVKAIVLNNRSLAWTKHGADEFFGEGTVSQDFGEVDFAAVARGFGCRAERITTASELEDGFRDIFGTSDGEPAVVDVRTSSTETPVQKLVRDPSRQAPVRTGY